MRAKTILAGLAALFFLLEANAQQSTSFNLYFVNPSIYNPAAAVAKDGFTLYTSYRHQWVGLNGSPEYIKFGAFGAINSKMGVSINASGYTNGLLSTNELNASYAYKVVISDQHNISFGLSYGLFRMGINRSENPEQTLIDPSAYSSSFDQTFFKTGFGISYKFKGLLVDVALPELYDQSKRAYLTSIYSFASYDFNLKGNKVIIKPLVGYRNYNSSASQFDFGVFCSWQKKVWLNAGYRTKNGMLFSGGVNVSKFAIAYSYELASSIMAIVSGGSNEISLMYSFGKSPKKAKSTTLIRSNNIPGNKFQ